MELGIGMFGDLTYDAKNGRFQPPGERLAEMIEQVKLADELGLDCFVLGEHHRADYAVSSPEIVLSALSAVTGKIKLASGVTVLSSADPVKVYQDFTTVDLLSGGRAEIMAGRGSFTESFPLFGYDLQNYNELFEEKLRLLLQLNEEEIINWEGEFRAPLHNQTVYPRPERKLPVWIAVGGTPESVYRAARHGLPVIFAIIGGMPGQFLPLIDFYREQYKEHGHDAGKMQVAIHSHSFVSASEEELIRNYFPYYAAQMDRIGKTRGWSPYTRMQFRGGIEPEGALFMGEPDRVADKIIDTVEMFGLTRFVAHVDVGGPGHKDLMKAIELYGTKVVPQVRKALGEQKG
ncbi:LLM class flavin-dependent oxidoreductase [Sinomicrobium pectinilyticum]|uniref:LLM class flavin-dependent oxidoreductase n=1 Tax=Sinomicrobium pectinilyticum TaxID=1084421 RepID=A0A3N0DZ35_SINP1|nr:LLM class flavin-dependent oxidoreductase [Sinomicrobium pectinilyticum]RNL80743.1 LLM class flavin-dependent oxidoreductase [Sinomicrobium pectinilyticum]